jgi:hypothetical protein
MIHREVDLKKLKTELLILQLHPMVEKLTCRDAISSKLPPKINELSKRQIEILLGNTVLNVVVSADGGYLLLESNLIYNLLIQHPAAKEIKVNLSIHSPNNEDELIALIDTLNLVQPAISLLESVNKSKTINARFLRLNEMGCKPTSLTFLAKLANKTESAFRR